MSIMDRDYYKDYCKRKNKSVEKTETKFDKFFRSLKVK